MAKLQADYIAEAPELMAFYSVSPRDLLSKAPQARPWTAALVSGIRSYNGLIGAGGALAGDEAVVATGQQPCIFSGPLYTVYKAVSAIRLARLLELRHGAPVVPLFWVAGDDHDFEEARTTHVLTKDDAPLTLRYEPASNVSGRPMARVPVEASLHDLVRTARSAARSSEHADAVEQFLHDSLDASASLAEWSTRILARLFHNTPLLFFSPDIPEARVAAVNVMEQAVADPLAVSQLVNAAGEQLVDAGYEQQVVKRDMTTGFFLDVDGRRRKVLFLDGNFRVPDEGMRLTPDEMRQALAGAPERFSANVALRCVVQQAMFPVAAYVAGPGELAYWAQLKPLFEHFGQRMPAVYPRVHCTLTTIKLKQFMQKYGFALGDFDSCLEALLHHALDTVVQGPARAILRAHRQALLEQADSLASALEREDVIASDMAGSMRRRIEGQLYRIERSILRRDKELHDTVTARVHRLQNALRPWRKPQERVYTVVSFLFEHGWGIAQRLIDKLDPEDFSMQEFEL